MGVTERCLCSYGKFFVFVLKQLRFACECGVLETSGGVIALHHLYGIRPALFARYTGRGEVVVVIYPRPRLTGFGWVSGHIVGPIVQFYSIDRLGRFGGAGVSEACTRTATNRVFPISIIQYTPRHIQFT